jgi:peptide deformylase
MTQPAKILFYPDPLFAQPATPRPVDDALRAIGADLLAVAKDKRAYGLAATHIGHAEPIVVVSFGQSETRDYRLLYNPEILALSHDTETGPEGSVSLPDIEVDIVRARSIRLAYDGTDGQRHEDDLSGFAARVAQHEIDQMNGVFFLDKLSRLKRDAALRRLRKLSR